MKLSAKSKEINSQSESFQLEAHQMKKYGFQISKRKIVQGSWSIQENKIYLQFLQENQQCFETEVLRRKNRVFYRISKLLKKRTPDQCRSHHQKLLIKHKGSLSEVIRELQGKTFTEIDLEINKNKDSKQKKTSPCTVQLINDGKKKDIGEQFIVNQVFDWYSVRINENFIQLNINAEFIKQW